MDTIENKRVIALFKNTRDVINAERICAEDGLKIKIYPVPKEVSSECGMSILLENKESVLNEFTTLMKQHHINFTIYEDRNI